jgi:hypothetical protein
MRPHVNIKLGRLKAFINDAEFPNPVPIVSVPIIVSKSGKDKDVHTENPERVKLPLTYFKAGKLKDVSNGKDVNDAFPLIVSKLVKLTEVTFGAVLIVKLLPLFINVPRVTRFVKTIDVTDVGNAKVINP